MKFDVYSLLFVFLAVPLSIGAWRIIAGTFASSDVDPLAKIGQGLGGIV